MYRAGGVAIDDRPELWVHAGGRDVLEQFGERFGFRDMFDRVFTVREYAPERAVHGRRGRGDPAAAAALHARDLRLPAVGRRHDDRVLRRQRPERAARRARTRHGSVRLRGDARPRRRRRPAARTSQRRRGARGGRGLRDEASCSSRIVRRSSRCLPASSGPTTGSSWRSDLGGAAPRCRPSRGRPSRVENGERGPEAPLACRYCHPLAVSHPKPKPSRPRRCAARSGEAICSYSMPLRR